MFAPWLCPSCVAKKTRGAKQTRVFATACAAKAPLPLLAPPRAHTMVQSVMPLPARLTSPPRPQAPSPSSLSDTPRRPRPVGSSSSDSTDVFAAPPRRPIRAAAQPAPTAPTPAPAPIVGQQALPPRQLGGWAQTSLRAEALRRTWEVYKSGLTDVTRAVVYQHIEVSPPATRAQVRCALWWTGLSHLPRSLGKDGCDFLLYRAALLIIQETPEFVGLTPLTHGHEVMTKFVSAMELRGRGDLPASGPQRASRLAAIQKKMQPLLALERPFETSASGALDAKARRIDGHSVAERFVFVLFSLELARLRRSQSLRLLRECEHDVAAINVSDFVTGLQLHRCALIAGLGHDDAAWQRLRVVLRKVCQYHERCEGDEERLACVPSPLRILLDVERDLISREPHAMGATASQLCEDFSRCQQAAPATFPTPMLLELAQALANNTSAADTNRARARVLTVLTQADEWQKNLGAPSRCARVHATHANLQGAQAILRTDAEDYVPFAALEQDDAQREALAVLARRLYASDRATLVPLVDALAYADDWGAVATQHVLTAVCDAPCPPTPLAFTATAAAVLDAIIGEDPGSGDEDPRRDESAASAFAAVLVTPGLGPSDSHAADVTLVRAMFGAHAGVPRAMSDEDRCVRLNACHAFGQAVGAHPGGRAYAYAALAAAERDSGFSRGAIGRIGELVSRCNERQRRLLWHLLRENARLSQRQHMPQLVALLSAGYAFQKSRAIAPAEPTPALAPTPAPAGPVPPSQRVLHILDRQDAAPLSFLLPWAHVPEQQR